MTELEAMTVRHSVRNFQDRPIPSDIQQKLLAEISKINRESGLHIQLVTDEPKSVYNWTGTLWKFFRRNQLLCPDRSKRPEPGR